MDAIEFRRICGRFATGVAVLTTALDGKLHGVTVNSVTSVSLDPLLLLVCIEKGAHAHEEIGRSGRFAVSFLADDQEAVSRTFAARGAPEAGSLRGAAFRFGPGGLPILEGCLAHFECELRDSFEGGDHTIFVARVQGGGVDREAGPLLFFQGKYGRLERP